MKAITNIAPDQLMLLDAPLPEPGQGQVRAFLSTGNFVARTVSLPNDASPFKVPDPQYGTAASLVTSQAHQITLILYYNDGTQVDPQREGVVNVTIQ